MLKSVVLLIGGASKVATGIFDRHDPITGELASQAAATTVADAITAVAAAAALPGWSARGRNERRALLNKPVVALEARAASQASVKEVAKNSDNEGRKQGIRKFIDKKNFKPGIGTNDLTWQQRRA